MKRLIGAAALSLSFALSAGAQGAPGGRGAPPQRQQMEQRLRQGFWRIARNRLSLTDDQMRRLEQASVKLDERRRALNVEERTQRQALRSELLAGDRANQDRVAAALDRLLQLHRDRIEIMADEQKELAGFMTPVQRARYAALQEQLRRRVEMARRERGPRAGVGEP